MGRPRWLSWMPVRLVIRRLWVRTPLVGNILSWRFDHKIFSSVILSLPLIQEGHLSAYGERMCTILVNHLEDLACLVNVWLGKLTTLDMIPLGWLGSKISTQTMPFRESGRIQGARQGEWIYFQGRQLCQNWFCPFWKKESTLKGKNLLLMWANSFL